MPLLKEIEKIIKHDKSTGEITIKIGLIADTLDIKEIKLLKLEQE